MGSAKVIIKQQDRSTIVPSLPGIYGGIVVRSRKGPVNEPRLITSENELIDVFGIPDTRYPEFYSAITYLQESDKLWVVRAAHEDVKYAGALVRGKVLYPDTSNPLAEFTDEMRIVQPLKEGLTEAELESFVFPVYKTNKEYALENISILEDLTDTDKVLVNSFGDLQVNDDVSFTTTSLAELNDPNTDVGELTPTFNISELETKSVDYDLISLADSVSVHLNDEILHDDGSGNYVSYSPKVYVARSADNTNQVLVFNADAMQPGDSIQLPDGTTTTFNEKEKVTITENWIHIDGTTSVDRTESVYKVVQAEYEDRDSFLVVGKDPSVDFNRVSVGVAPSKNYDEAFNVLVYFDGVLVETFEVTKTDFIDGFGKQLYIEDVINNQSNYIKVVDNKNYEQKPLNTDHSYWRQLNEDIFRDTGVTLEENVLEGHTQVHVSDVSGFTVGDRIKFAYDVDTEGNKVLSKEYKVDSIDSTNNYIFLDRPLEEYEIDKTYVDNDGNTQNTTIYKFDETYTDLSQGIVNGVKHFPITRLDKVFYNYPIGKIVYISDVAGTLLDAGVNLLVGGDEGSTITLGDMITALKKLENSGETPVTLLLQGGYYDPAYAQALLEVAEAQDLTHVYLSTDPNAEDSSDWKTAVVNYAASLNMDTEKASLFAGWVKIFDSYNQKYVWVGPDAFAAASQSYTYRNYYMWYPAAGWLRGKITVLDSKIKPNEGDRDYLVDNKINPLKYVKGSGFAIWGNRTMYIKPSPLNDRSVAMLLIVIKYGLKNMLEYKVFELNVEQTWNDVENSITNFLADIKSKNGLYDFSVAVKSIITPEDIDNNRMPVFVGIKPTRSIKEIPVTLAIYNFGSDIQVQL